MPEGLVGLVHGGEVVAGFRLEPRQARFVEAFAAGESPPRFPSIDEMAVARRRYDKALIRAAMEAVDA